MYLRDQEIITHNNMTCLGHCSPQYKCVPVKEFLMLLPPATKLRDGNVFTSVCQEFCPPGRGHAWHTRLLSCMPLAMHAPSHACPPTMHAPLPCPPPHTHPATHTPCHVCPPAMHFPLPCMPPATHAPRYYEMRSMSGRYASYWNAFLLHFIKSPC